eukprot:jgi/Phyca11/508211/fgenesh2_kg.PHYCAscaffold_33_\
MCMRECCDVLNRNINIRRGHSRQLDLHRPGLWWTGRVRCEQEIYVLYTKVADPDVLYKSNLLDRYHVLPSFQNYLFPRMQAVRPGQRLRLQ